MPFPGEPISLVVNLNDGETNRFIKAILKDEFETEISGSPATLTHKGNGQYTNYSVSYPTAPKYVAVTYIPYMDAGFTVEDGKYGEENACFEKSIEIPAAGTVIITPVNLKGKLGATSVSSALGATEVKKNIGAREVTGKIEKRELEGEVAKPRVEGTISVNELESQLGCRKGG